jgi:CASC3/Barentsz eIF4AIII binding
MPAPVLTPSKAHNKALVTKENAQSKSNKTRIVRRRGRARDVIDSDDELEREARSDSGSDDDKSSIDSDSDADSVHSDRILHNGHFATITPSTTQSPQPDDKDLTNGLDSSNDHHANGIASGPFAAAATDDWSEMVSAENAWATLPILDFSKLGESEEPEPKASSGSRPRRTRKTDKKPKAREDTGPPQDEPENEQPNYQPVASTSRRGRSAREAYQSRLQTDPSYVPTVGEFWGHDDRLLDKELRSLSGWWRGKWGRGGMPGGRGGRYLNARNWLEPDEHEVDAARPTDRPWGHDGFEEMKKREEQRSQQARRDSNYGPVSAHRGTAFRGGRGIFPARGRGGFNRGGFVPSPRSNSAHSDRPWFAMKPERMWTKQLDWFLHSDPSLKPRLGQGQGFRVKLAGSGKEHVVRTPPRRYSFPQPSNPTTTTQGDIPSAEDDDNTFIVRLPIQVSEVDSDDNTHPSTIPNPLVSPPSVPTADETEESLEDVFTVKPRTVPSAPIPLPALRDSISSLPVLSPPINSRTRSELIERAVVKSPPAAQHPVVDSVDSTRSPPKEEPLAHPILSPIQTVFSPAPQPQSFNTSYQYGPALPPGVAMNSQGMAYEVATGRPVYLQSTPPLYDPRPLMATHMPLHANGVAFVPSHVPHHSNGSPDYMTSHSLPRTPSMTGFVDPATGLPIFSFPRQNSRIEIRRPTDTIRHSMHKSSTSHAYRPSGLRTTVSTVEATVAQEGDETQIHYYPSIEGPSEDHDLANSAEQTTGVRHPDMDPTVMSYQPYQPYYYPDYGYPAYVDASRMHYDMYQDHHNPQPAIYY